MGDFASSISSKLSVGESLSDEDKNILQQFSQYCNILAGNLNEIQENIAEQEVVIGQSEEMSPKLRKQATLLLRIIFFLPLKNSQTILLFNLRWPLFRPYDTENS